MTGGDRNWTELAEFALRRAQSVTRKHALDLELAEEIAQETIVQFWLAENAGRTIESTSTWVSGTLRHLAADHAMGRCRGIHALAPARSDAKDPDDTKARKWSDPERNATLEDLWSRAPKLLAQLPPPCRQLAILQFIHGFSRLDLEHWLRSWRPIGAEEVRRLLRRTHSMLRGLGDGGARADVRFSGQDPRQNPWSTTPPPPLVRPRRGGTGSSSPGPDRRGSRIAEIEPKE